MEGLPVIISVLAILISLAAIWMASDLLKRSEASHREFYMANVKAVKDAVTDFKASQEAMLRRLADLERQAAATAEKADRAEARVAALENALRGLAEGLAALDRSIPQRFRQTAKQNSDPKTPGDHSVQ